MSVYLKLMYDQWCNGQSELEIKERYNEFVIRAASMLSRTEDEVLDELMSSSWFKVDDNSVI